MKKLILFFLFIFINFSILFSQEKKITITQKTYSLISNESLFDEDQLCFIKLYSIEYDKEGYIKQVTITSQYNEDTTRLDELINVDRISTNKIKIYTKIYDSTEDKYNEYNDIYVYKNKSWVLDNDSTIQIQFNNYKITYLCNNIIYDTIEFEKDKFNLNLSDENYYYTVKNGYFTSFINSFLLQAEDEEAKKDAIGDVTQTDNKIIITTHYYENTEVYEIENNYNFVSLKVSTFNKLITISDPVIIPFILGFGNGFEFKEGVDYSGENEEPLKKNDETLEPVQPVTSKNNTPVIIIIAALLSIFLVCTIIIIAKKKKK